MSRDYRYSYDGSAARELETFPYGGANRKRKKDYDHRRQIERKARNKRLYKKQRSAKVSAVYFTLCLAFTLGFVLVFLQKQQELRGLDEKITSLEKELISIKNENLAISDMKENVDLDYVKDYAMNTLGMVHPKDNQIIKYEAAKKDYVKQYARIPNGDK